MEAQENRRFVHVGFHRKVTASGPVRLGAHRYWVGRGYVGQLVTIRLDATQGPWVFYQGESAETLHEVQRKALQGLEFETLTCLKPHAAAPMTPFQLCLPLSAGETPATILQDC